MSPVSPSPQNRFYFPQIDGLRCLAFVMVFFGHFYDVEAYFPGGNWAGALAWPLNKRGWAGVDVFLVLSSFLIFSLLLQERDAKGTISVARFYVRRALRIWPLYFPYLIISMVIVPLALGHQTSAVYLTTLRQHLFPFLVFLGNFSYAYFPDSLTPIFAHLWTVCLEEQFYVVPPMLILLAAFRLNRPLVVVACAALAISMATRLYIVANAIPYPMIWVNPLCRLDPFVIGAVCAAAFHDYRH